MPLTHFICPDKAEIAIKDCLASCRMGGRCVSKPTLILMSRQRAWKGKISATQALNGTRLEYLKIKYDYAEAPVSRAFALLGTIHHAKLEGMEVPEALMEERLEDEIGHGTFDYYDPAEKALYDYKTAGSYKINRVLGKKKITIDVETGEIYKTGARKGEPKTRKEHTWSMVEPDTFDWQMQCSRYAWMLIDMGFPVEKIYVQATVRDFTKQTARQYGLDRQIYIIQLDVLPKDVVENFYRTRQAELAGYLSLGVIPPPCEPKERWADDDITDNTTPGRRCIGFCPVWSHCDLGIRAHEQPEDEEGVA